MEQAISQRRTIRSFSDEILTLNQVSQLLWAAQGITGKSGFKRSAPSAGALYPMDVYTVVGKNCIALLEAGVYHYSPDKHTVNRIEKKDRRNLLSKAALSQNWLSRAPVSFIITAEYSRIKSKYGSRGYRYAMIEAGHIGQNIFLQAQALGIQTGIIGAFHDREVVNTLNLPRSHEPLLIMPAGHKKRKIS